jgi:hypothetical protein
MNPGRVVSEYIYPDKIDDSPASQAGRRIAISARIEFARSRETAGARGISAIVVLLDFTIHRLYNAPT